MSETTYYWWHAYAPFEPGEQNRPHMGKVIHYYRELREWSIKDLLAHLVGWDYTNIEAVREIRDGRNPSCFQHWNPNWAAYNARLVQEHKQKQMADMLDALRKSHDALMSYLDSVPVADFEKDFGIRSPRGQNITVAYHLQAEIDDEREHCQQIKTFAAETGR